GSVAPGAATTLGGVATATISSTLAGTALVTATAAGASATTLVTFTAGAPASIALTATPNLILANGISQSVVVAQVTDAFGNPVPGVPVLFLAGIGSFSPNSGTTDAAGRVTVTLTSTVPGPEMVYGVMGSLSGGVMVTYTQPPAPDTGLGGNLTTVTNTLGVVRKGDIITYTVVITNSGSGVVNNILLYAPIPSGTTYVAGSATGGGYFGSLAFSPLATLAGVVWSGSLAPGESHTLSYAVQAQILEGQITNEPKVFVDNVDTGIVLSSIVEVEALRIYLPIVAKP
ncbi:MAG: Ig-like domain-containing protein, partial [Thermoflexales bacterium]